MFQFLVYAGASLIHEAKDLSQLQYLQMEYSLHRSRLVYKCDAWCVSTKIFPSHSGPTLHTLLHSHTESSETQFPQSISAVTSSLSVGSQRNNGVGGSGVFWRNPAQVTGGHFICRRGGGEANFIISTQDKLLARWKVSGFSFIPTL